MFTKFYGKFLVVLVIFFLGLGFGSQLVNRASQKTQTEKNTPKAFILEVYQQILANYWDNLSETQLLDFFKLSFEKNGGGTVAKFDNIDKLLNTISDVTKSMDEGKRNQFVTQIAGTVLASLNPAGRSGLFTQKMEQQLKNTVDNIDPGKDLYQDLGLTKGASEAAVEEAYQKQSKQLAKDQSKKAKEKLQEIAYAKDVLSGTDTKARYDQNQVEPTIFTKVFKPAILYVQFKKFSPTSYDEFIKAFDTYKDNTALTSLIFDLRGNIGGAIDTTAYFLGPFIGKNAYAFDFYHKGEYLPFKTPTEKLPSVSKYKQKVILVDSKTQSSAEMITASFKRYHVGVVVGTPTKGWGTVERVFPLDNQIDLSEKYSLLLVHSITLRDDNLPIEGRGVEPDINIKNNGWEQQLFNYFRNSQLISTVKELLSTD